LGEFEQEYNLFKTKDHRNYLEQCDMALYLIKHERNLKSKYLRKEIEYLNKNNRLFLLILMDKKIISENIKELNSFNVIVLDDSLNLAERTENIKRLKLFIEQSLNMFEKKHKPIELKFNLIKTIDSERSRLIQKEKVNLMENEIIIRISDKILKYFNIQTKKLILEIRVDSIISGFCLIKHLQQLLVITRSNTTFIASFYSKTGEFLREIDIGFEQFLKLDSIYYSELCQTTFLKFENKIFKLNENFFVEYSISIKGKLELFNEYFYSWFRNEICIYDQKLHHFASYYTDSKIECLLFDSIQTNYAFIKLENNFVLVFYIKNFSIIGIIKHEFQPVLILNKSIVFCDDNNFYESYLFYKINIENTIKKIDERMLCEINPVFLHLYDNPYLLPCGNTACLNCISKQYDITLKKFKCGFESCEEFHQLPQKLEKDVKSIELLGLNCGKYIEKMLETGCHLITSIKSMYEIFYY
jgi:hypothetical protein